MPDNVNKDFRDFILKRNHYLYRYENGVLQDMVAPYNIAKADLIRELGKIQATGIGYTRDWRIERLRTQLAEIEAMLQAAAMESAGALEKATAELAYLEAEIYTQMLKDGLAPIGINIKGIPLRQIDFIVMNPLIYKYRNMTFRDIMLWANNDVVNLMRTTLTQSIIQGEDMTQAANRLVGLGKSLGGEIGNKIISKAKIIARSEIQHVSNEVARAIFAGNTDVLAGVKFVATLDNRTCAECMDLDGTIYKYKNGADHEGPIIPIHPFCFIDYQIPIYTSKGFKKIGEIKVGDKVLTHKGRFRKVTDTIRHKVKQPKVVTIYVQYPKLTEDKRLKPNVEKITVTEDHPFFVNEKWIAAKDIKIGAKFKYLATKCNRCEKLIPYDKKYCSQSCTSKDITDRQWSDPEHKKNVSEKNRISVIEQYSSGRRDPYKTTARARERTAEMFEQGLHPFQQKGGFAGDKNPSKRPEVRKKISVSKMGKNNPMVKYPHLAVAHGRKMKIFLKENPDRHPNRIMSQKGFESSLERMFREGMEEKNLIFEKQHPINGSFVDFAFPEKMIAIEVDGDYWHKDKIRDMRRQEKIESEGWTVLRYSEGQVNNELESCIDEVCRIVNNHSGNFLFMDLEVVEVKHWIVSGRGVSKRGNEHIKTTTLYNFSVEEDESYIARGFVSHNCRCIYSPVTKSWAQLEREEGVKVPVKDREYYSGKAADTVTYQKWLKIKEKNFMESLGDQVEEFTTWLKSKSYTYPNKFPFNEPLDMLGKNIYRAWRNGKLTFNGMAKSSTALTFDGLIEVGNKKEMRMSKL